MTARWEDALDAQLDLFTFLNTDLGRRFVEGYAWSLTHDKDPISERSLIRSVLPDLPDRLRTMTLAADPVWVDPDMQTLWEAAAKEFVAEPLVEEDLLAPFGFVYLPRPFPWLTKSGNTSWRAILWAKAQFKVRSGKGSEDYSQEVTMDGVVLAFFHRVGDPENIEFDGDPRSGDQIAMEAGAARGSLMLDHLMPWIFDAMYDDDGSMRVPVQHKTDPDGIERMTQTKQNATANWHLESPNQLARNQFNSQRPMQALWRLMQQTITTNESTRAPKPFRRRWERLKLDARPVTVIRLRRPHEEPDDDHMPRPVDWRHRWIVSGHWRQQWYPSLSLHRQIWVSGYVKGPPDKELVVRKSRVFELVR
jgi:hypothetical protein